MKKTLLTIILWGAFSAPFVMLSSCSDEEGGAGVTLNESSIPEEVISGTWRLHKVGATAWMGKEKTFLFQENGTVTFHYDDNDYHGTYSIMNPCFADGKINCILTVSYTDKGSQRIYDCIIERNLLMLNDMSLSEVVDATETYKRIK